jgi:hypothetical protein
VICLAGQQCDIDLPVEFYEDYHDPSYTEGCFASTCSAYLVGSITVSTFSFKTPNQPDSMRIYVSGSVNVDGYIAGYYSNGVVGWELWHASFAGRGTERVELQNVGWNDYGQTQYLAVGAYARYFATGSGMEEVSETPAPGTSASGLALGNNSLFISQPGALGTISQLDKATGAVHNTFLTPSANGFDGRSTPSDIAFDGNHLFMTDMGSPGAGAVYDIDPLGTVVHNSFTLPFRGGALGVAGRRLFVEDLDSGQVLVTSRSGTPITSFTLPFKAAGMVFDASKNWLWVTSQSNPRTIWEFTTKGSSLGYCQGPWNPGSDGLGGISVSHGTLYASEVGKINPYDDRAVVSSVEARILYCSPALPITPQLAINPGLPIKPIDPGSSEPISVAVLSSTSFDAATIDTASIHFGDTGIEAGPLDSATQDVNGDGRDDLLLHFGIPNSGITCWTTVVSLTGKAASGQSVRGSGAILTKKCN